MLRVLTAFMVVFALVSPGRGADSKDPSTIKSLIRPGDAFYVKDRPAFILWPEKNLRSTPQPWVFYGPTLAAYPDGHEKWMHQQFLSAGVAVAGINVGEGWD